MTCPKFGGFSLGALGPTDLILLVEFSVGRSVTTSHFRSQVSAW
jgi:hypothetical protein